LLPDFFALTANPYNLSVRDYFIAFTPNTTINMLLRNIVGLFLLSAISLPSRSQHNAVSLPAGRNNIIVIAHRGNHVTAPENTLASCREAIACGADYVEVDLRTTKDGHLIVLHDATVDRMTNGKGRVSDMTLGEVKKLQVFNRNKKTHRIPEFREVLALCKNKIHVYLDFKDADVAETWKEIEAAGMESQIVIYLNKPEQYQQWKGIAPQVPLMTSLSREVVTNEQLLHFLEKTNVKVLDNVTDPEMVSAANALGVSVWLDVQSPEEGPVSWEEALNKEIQGLQTDKPRELIEYLRANNRR
jgi:glycerophosphoryl diester phosphodiesterase